MSEMTDTGCSRFGIWRLGTDTIWKAGPWKGGVVDRLRCAGVLSLRASHSSVPWLHTPGKLRHVLSKDGFLSYLCSKDGDIFNPACLPIYQDMTQPLSHYYINSSHNTYLVGDQLCGQSSIEGYIRCCGELGGRSPAHEKGLSVGNWGQGQWITEEDVRGLWLRSLDTWETWRGNEIWQEGGGETQWVNRAFLFS